MADLLRLGKALPRYDSRTLKLTKYLDLTVLPTPPVATNRLAAVGLTFPMFANNFYGDCTAAGMAHMSMLWSALASSPLSYSDADVLGAYAAITGFDPVTGANDNGAVELDVLKWWQSVGFAGHKIAAFAAVNLANRDLFRAAIYLFDGLYIGVALPASAQGQEEWTYKPETGSQANPGSWGEHCVNIADYDESGVSLISWGKVIHASWDFLDRYCDEAYAVLAPEAFNTAAGNTAEGFDLATLTIDLARVA